MSEPVPPAPPPSVLHVETQQPGLIGLGRALIGTMPPAFLMLCLVNLGFLYMVMTFMERQSEQMDRAADQKIALYTQVVEKCILSGPLEGKRFLRDKPAAD